MLGLGSRSTLFYLEKLNQLYNELHGGYSTCPLKLLNANFNDINPLLPNVSPELIKNVEKYVKELISLNIDALLIPNITLHETIDIVFQKEFINVPVIHPVKITADILSSKNHKNVIVLGSMYTMQSSYITSIFTNKGITVNQLPKEEMLFVDKVRREIYEEDNQQLIKEFNELLSEYAAQTSIVIACTELSIANKTVSDNVLDMVTIQIEKAIQSAFQ
ncbi:aspartate/glutamate racemase family protein [Tenacibaculum sp. M341]|uniref:aspartate/glutamate racemase family protein n=1 Tax=Tenacibaculum sp. M341 TaxID=2530339 RepID=UPI0010435BF8|nr:aspartate/glutamate racemase family protein [Tenacibaculum sp. M341]TCI92788.1 aspartate/glutamate racemase family protein [Tenacibaculum sp. M341]